MTLLLLAVNFQCMSELLQIQSMAGLLQALQGNQIGLAITHAVKR